MVQTPSQMIPLGTPAPDFSVQDPKGRIFTLASFADAKGLLVVFMCNHCPFVKHVAAELARIGRDCAAKNIAMIGINSNDIERYPQDGPQAMLEEAKARGYTFPYALDSDQSAARVYGAACTPDFFLFDGDRRLFYRGQLDDSRPGNQRPVDGKDLRAAIDALLQGRPMEAQKPSIGCNIKWKPGNEPAWFG